MLGIFKQLGAKVYVASIVLAGRKVPAAAWFLGTLLTPAIGGTLLSYHATAAPPILGDDPPPGRPP